MISAVCQCGGEWAVGEDQANAQGKCPECGKPMQLVCAEQLPEGAGAGDFDARLIVTAGPGMVGQQFVLGGCMELAIGKLADKQIVLPGNKVSRFHCKLSRVDFGPSRWTVHDNKSTNGLFVNGHRVEMRELADGDEIQVGEYTLGFHNLVRRAVAQPPPLPTGASVVCPCCEQALPPMAKVCVKCGIHVASGRRLRTSQGLDDELRRERIRAVLRFVSLFIWLGIFPVSSEAFGRYKAYFIGWLAAVTIVASCIYYMVDEDYNGDPTAAAQLALWVGDPGRKPTVAEAIRHPEKLTKTQLELVEEYLSEWEPSPYSKFHPHQLLTHALLHGGAGHLVGNMVFLLVLGTAVNRIIGNGYTALAYPLLAVAGGLAHMVAASHELRHEMIGASGAVMGLAGMYFVLAPVHKIHMAVWILPGALLHKTWALRGFWVVLMAVGFDVLYTSLGVRDHVAHWAHMGGFITGMLLAVGLLMTRRVNAHGGDILSVILGKRAWPLIGKPTQWKKDFAAKPAAAASASPAVPVG